MDDTTRSAAPAAEGTTTSTTPRVRLRDFSRSLPMALLRSREAVMRHFRAALRRAGLTEQQWRVLRALMSVTEIEVTDLARVTCLLGPSLSRILRDLEERGLILRRPDAADQRRALIAIAPQGRAVIETTAPLSEAIYAELTRRFGADDMARLHDMLRLLEARLSEGPPIGDGLVDDVATDEEAGA